MEENWIKIETYIERSKVQEMTCRLTFHDSLSVVLDDDDIDHLIRILNKYRDFKKEFLEVVVDGEESQEYEVHKPQEHQ